MTNTKTVELGDIVVYYSIDSDFKCKRSSFGICYKKCHTQTVSVFWPDKSTTLLLPDVLPDDSLSPEFSTDSFRVIKKMKNRKKKPKDRNIYAVTAWKRSGAGKHKNKKAYNRKTSKKVEKDD